MKMLGIPCPDEHSEVLAPVRPCRLAPLGSVHRNPQAKPKSYLLPPGEEVPPPRADFPLRLFPRLLRKYFSFSSVSQFHSKPFLLILCIDLCQSESAHMALEIRTIQDPTWLLIMLQLEPFPWRHNCCRCAAW